jgi:hypothetical protein
MAKLTDAAEKKFQSVVHHHGNIIKSAQHHWMAPGALRQDVLDEILNHTLLGNETKHCLFVNYTSDLFQVDVSHLYDPQTLQFTLIVHHPLISNANLLKLYKFFPLQIHLNFLANVSITSDVGKTTSWQLDILNLFKLSPAQIFIHASTSTSFAKEGNDGKFEQVLYRLILSGQCRSHPDHVQIQGCWSFRGDFRTRREHLGSLFN